MSTYEKIALVVVGIFLTAMIIFSYHEFKEPPEQRDGLGAGSRFDESLGQDFKIGPFTNIVSEQSSRETEDACEPLQPVIIAALHDIKNHLEMQENPALAFDTSDTFEVNEQTLQLFCHKNAEVILSDSNGNQLLLQKMPFTRAVPPGSAAADIGTEVRINATVVPVGKPVPTEPTTYGDILIPDRFLDATSSSAP